MSNYLEYKGIKKKVNVIKLIARIFKRPDFEDVLEPSNNELNPEEKEVENEQN